MVFGRFLLSKLNTVLVIQEQHLWGASSETGLCGRFLYYIEGRLFENKSTQQGFPK
jgi:hypothetical protein